MAEESIELRKINWRETFAFIHLFRAFRLAIHPSKLVLGLTALIVIFVTATVLDFISGPQIVPGQIQRFIDAPSAKAYSASLESVKKRNLRELTALVETLTGKDRPQARQLAQSRAGVSRLWAEKKNQYDNQRQDLRKGVNHLYDKVEDGPGNPDKIIEAINVLRTKTDSDTIKQFYGRVVAAIAANPPTDDAQDRVIDLAYNTYLKSLDAEEKDLLAFQNRLTLLAGQPIFRATREFLFGKFTAGISAAMQLNFTGGVLSASPAAEKGVIRHVLDGILGLVWLGRYCPIHFVIMLIVWLFVWSIAGGAICRIAALQLARDEKISIKTAVKFSTSKFLSFFFAPLIPVAILLVIGIIMGIGGLVGAIPYVGELLNGLLFFLALMGGFVMTLVLVGLAGGLNLMYPTIATEGSDSFDAISRSFSYIYARPWSTAFYTVVSMVYGAACYLFVRLFVLLVLILTRGSLNVGMGCFGLLDGSRDGMSKLNAMWPEPTFADLSGAMLWARLDVTESIAAFMIGLWVLVLIGLLVSFGASFFFSSSSIIYFLLRRKVDATDMEDVYVEEEIEEELPPDLSEEESEEETPDDEEQEEQKEESPDDDTSSAEEDE